MLRNRYAALLIVMVTGCAQARAEPSTSASASLITQASVPAITIPAPRLVVETLRQLRTLIRDERANRKAFGR